MKGSVIAMDRIFGRQAAARIVDGALDDLLVDPPDDRVRPGAIYRAKAGRPMKGQGGMILETPDGPLFLRNAKGIAQGDTALVQASTYAEREKAAPATQRILFKGRHAMLTPGAPGRNISRAIMNQERRAALQEILDEVELPESLGIVLRTGADTAEDADVREEIGRLADIAGMVLNESRSGGPARLLDGPSAPELALRDWPRSRDLDDSPGSFDRFGVDEMIDALRSPHVMFGGGSVAVEPTRALVAVDVNAAGSSSTAAGLKANLAALRALPRALRLRGLGGQILVDLAPLAKRDRRRVEDTAKSAFRACPVDTTFAGWTPLGHMELLRKRERLPLHEVLT
ncbi:MAG: ribonuclease E/G [Boseongicola sp.]|nr:ribonuclease E/G [Boseongicola sp.]